MIHGHYRMIMIMTIDDHENAHIIFDRSKNAFLDMWETHSVDQQD